MTVIWIVLPGVSCEGLDAGAYLTAEEAAPSYPSREAALASVGGGRLDGDHYWEAVAVRVPDPAGVPLLDECAGCNGRPCPGRCPFA